jgi:hypothetical protein
VVILVDSESSHSVINVKLAPDISGVSALFKPVRVQVANGNIIQCSSEFKHISWSIQDHQFILDLKVLPLPYYDMILGMDCLDCHSPMKVEWNGLINGLLSVRIRYLYNCTGFNLFYLNFHWWRYCGYLMISSLLHLLALHNLNCLLIYNSC